jgi:hypothetical protein
MTGKCGNNYAQWSFLNYFGPRTVNNYRAPLPFPLVKKAVILYYKYEIFLVQQMHYLLKHKILQFVFKCLNVHFSAPKCFGPLGPSSGSIHQNFAKVTKITVL